MSNKQRGGNAARENKKGERDYEKEQAHLFGDAEDLDNEVEAAPIHFLQRIPVGKTIAGKLVDMYHDTNKLDGDKPRTRAKLEVDGEMVVLPAHRQLTDALARIKVGSSVVVRCIEKTVTGKNQDGTERTAWQYRVTTDALPF